MKLRTKAPVAVGCICVLVLGTIPVFAGDILCSQCGPGDHWVDDCPAGSDLISKQGAVVGIDTDLDCVVDMSLVLHSCGTDFEVSRGAGVPHTITPTEIVDLCMTNGTQILIAGDGNGQGGVLAASLGSIVETGDPAVATSSFDMMFEFDLGGGNYVYNQTPLVISSDITCVPPRATYIHPTGCTPLFDSPIVGQGDLVANLVSADHTVVPIIPTVSEWGVVAMVLLVMAAGTVVIRRFRSVPA